MKMSELNDWLILVANIGVIIGLGLLVYEIRQNSELVKAEIHSIRSEGKANRQMDLANNGVASTIIAKAVENGFPNDPGYRDSLTPEEQMRLGQMFTAIAEVTSNWHVQCQLDLLMDETCADIQRKQILWLMPRLRATGGSLYLMTPGFVSEVQRVMTEAGLEPPNDDGTWPER